MQQRYAICLTVIILFLSFQIAGGTQFSGPDTTKPVNISLIPPKGTVITLKDVISYVDAAASFARENGKEKALAEFNNQNSVFNTGELYIFSEDMNGTALAEPFEPSSVGSSILNFTDPYGIPVVHNILDIISERRILVSYHYCNPEENDTPLPKVSYIVNVDGTYYLGAGYYGNMGTKFPAAGLKSEQQDITKEELVSFVEEARDYARRYGKEEAISAYMNKSGLFVKDERYIIAYDFDKKNLANPNSALIQNISLKYYNDQDSVATISELSDIAQNGGGFAHTTQQIPIDGRLVFAPKLHYTLPVDDTWWISAAILNPDFTGIRSGNLTGIRIRNNTQEELYTLVNRAVQFAKENGKERTLAEINNASGQFTNGDLFVWASDYDGVLLADPYLKDLVGKSLMNYTDSYGVKTTQVGISSMRNGTGFVHELFPDTSTGSQTPVMKLVYQKAVDDTWWIGGGIYGVEVR